MTFEFKNLGAIKDAQIEMGNLTIVSGKNNTGKTYLTYAMTGFFSRDLHNLGFIKFIDTQNAHKFAEELIKVKTIKIDVAYFEEKILQLLKNKVDIYKNNLHRFFGIDATFNKDTKIKLKEGKINYERFFEGTIRFFHYEIYYFKPPKSSIIHLDFIDKNKADRTIVSPENIEYVSGIISLELIQMPVIVLSNIRNAIHLFSKSLKGRTDIENRKKVHDAYDAIETDKLIKTTEYSYQYAQQKTKNFQFEARLGQDDILNYVESMLPIKYQAKYYELYAKVAEKEIPSHLCSASIQALADLHFYLKYTAQKGHLLIIDEPELNLHPENQIKIARLLVKLVNAGIRVWITTHSDYIVKELNNCLMLSNDFTDKEAFMQEYEYKENDILKKEDIRVYIAHEEGTVEQVEIGKFGMKKTTFDDAIKRFNEVSDTLFNILG